MCVFRFMWNIFKRYLSFKKLINVSKNLIEELKYFIEELYYKFVSNKFE